MAEVPKRFAAIRVIVLEMKVPWSRRWCGFHHVRVPDRGIGHVVTDDRPRVPSPEREHESPAVAAETVGTVAAADADGRVLAARVPAVSFGIVRGRSVRRGRTSSLDAEPLLELPA